MLHFLNKMSIHVHISHLLNNKILRVTQLILMLLPPRFMLELLPRRMRELSIDHARKSPRVDFLDKCAKYARILREFRTNFVGLCVDLNPFRAFPRITREREPSNFRSDCTVQVTLMLFISSQLTFWFRRRSEK